MWRTILLYYIYSSFVITISEEINCGYSSCHPTRDDYINVHIIPHTHDDVGWIRTFDEYYNDEKNGVKEIINSVFQALLDDKNRRFIYVESAFFFKWWNEQEPTLKTWFKELVNNGQLEFVGGAWSMNDEATTNYQSIIDQFTLGLSKLNETFGVCGRPKVGWQIDPFGHSKEMASIFAQLGFDGLFLGRIDYQDKIERVKTKNCEMIWRGSYSLEKEPKIFTSVLFNMYHAPKGFCYDAECPYDFIYDKQYKWPYLLDFLDRQAEVYRTNNIILTMGDDFSYSDAENWFRNLDELIEYGNTQENSKYHLLYSTPSCYLKAVRRAANTKKIEWPTKTDDFFPYADEEYSYWTGFYTTRPTLKRFERMGNNFLQVCKQLYVLGNLTHKYKRKLDSLRKAMGVLQHHDAVSGTALQYVAEDYANILTKSLKKCGIVASKALNTLLLGKVNDAPALPVSSCLLSNISQCEITENNLNFIVTIYNPLSRPVSHYVRIPVRKGYYSVTQPTGKRALIQLLPIPKKILNIPGRNSLAVLELVFRACEIPPLGFKSYYVKKIKANLSRTKSKEDKKFISRKPSIRFSKQTGFLSKVIMNGRTVPIRQEFLYYEDTNSFGRGSGPYVFQSRKYNASPVSKNLKYAIHKGKLVNELHQTFSSWVSQIIRTYHEENFIELQWLVGPLPYDSFGSNVISRFTTDLKTESAFFTDSNGRGLLKRIRNFRPTWKLESSESVSGNYYPVTSNIVIRDAGQDLEVAVLTDRSEGGSSLRDGQIELMVHRNSPHNYENLGISETLDERAFGERVVVRGSHYLLVGPYINNSKVSMAAIKKDLSQRKLLEAWTFLSSVSDLSYQEYKKLYILEYSGLKRALPKNIQILTLEPWGLNSFLLRLEHVFEKCEDPLLSKPATVDIEHLFSAFTIKNLREATLGANQWLDENNRTKPTSNFDKAHNTSFQQVNDENKFVITLKHMQIRTFVVEFIKNT